MASNSFRKHCSNVFFRCFAFRFVIKTDILHIIVGSLLQTRRKAGHKTLEQRFLKEFKATYKTSGEAELKQQNAI